jgi:hypothetical protein
MKRAGSILGFMPLPQGAPPKADVAPSPPDLPAWQKVVSKQSKRRRRYISWKHGDNKLALDAAVDAILIDDDHKIASREIVPGILIPRATLEHVVAQERARRAALDEHPDDGLFNQTTDDLINEKKNSRHQSFVKISKTSFAFVMT